VGIIAYMLLTGRHPIYRHGDTINTYVQKLKDPILDSIREFPEDLSELAKDFFLRLIKIDPLERYTAEEALQHPWITRIPRKIPLSYTEQGCYERTKQVLSNVRLMNIGR